MPNDEDNLAISPSVPGGHEEPRGLGKFLEDLRKRRGMTRAALAKATGISVHSLSKYEKEGKVPTAGRLALICLHLRLDPRIALQYSLGDGDGEWLAFGPDRNSEGAMLWGQFQDFISDLDKSPPLTDPDSAQTSPSNASLKAQLDELSSSVRQLTESMSNPAYEKIRADADYENQSLRKNRVQVHALHVGGLSNKQISERLNLEEKYVEYLVAEWADLDKPFAERWTELGPAALANKMKSGPDHEDPSRPESTYEAEAVDATSHSETSEERRKE